MRIEHELILRGLNGADQSFDDEKMADIDWGDVIETAERIRVATLLWWHLDAAGVQPPFWVYKIWRAVTLFTDGRNNALARETRRVLEALSARDIRAAVRKGGYLANAVYPTAALRPMNDIDLLVSRRDLTSAVAALRELGYEAGRLGPDGATVTPLSRDEVLFFRLHTHGAPPMHRPSDDPHVEVYTVDLVTDIGLPGLDAAVDTDGVLDRAIPYRVDGHPAAAPAPLDFLLDLCCHTYKESTTLRYVARGGHRRLIQYCDIVQLCRTGFDWTAFLATASACGATAECFFTLGNLNRLFPGTVPVDVVDALAGHRGHEFLDRFGGLDLPEPLSWDSPLETRVFDLATPDIPRSLSLI